MRFGSRRVQLNTLLEITDCLILSALKLKKHPQPAVRTRLLRIGFNQSSFLPLRLVHVAGQTLSDDFISPESFFSHRKQRKDKGRPVPC